MASSDTGQYTLRQLLGDDLSLVIPDMQRDYCWGTDNVPGDRPREKVTSFVSWLVYMYRHNRPLTLGLLYGYAMPQRSHTLHIIDGQQRLTTLYLLIGMLYRRTGSPGLRGMLAADPDEYGETRPRLVYQVRNEALYFMSDLVGNFFIRRDGRLSDLEKSSWYFRIYDNDPSVQSFIGAIRRIDAVLERAATLPDWDFEGFASFLVDDLRFMYYDLHLRSRAERMFIKINTTGLPLSRPQNLKTMLYSTAADPESFARRWEKMEQWCWRYRHPQPDDGPYSADAALDRVITLWITRYRLTHADTDPADIDASAFAPDCVDGFFGWFDAYAKLCDANLEAAFLPVDNSDGVMIMLGSVEYTMRWHVAGTDMMHMLQNITRYQHALANGTDAVAAMTLAQTMPSSDITSLLSLRGKAPRLLNDEERVKLALLADTPTDHRETLRAVLARGEAHPLLNGRMARLIAWSTDKEKCATQAHVSAKPPGSHRPEEHKPAVNITRLRRYVDCIYNLFGTDLDAGAPLDGVRNRLLALHHPGYPLPRRYGTATTLCTRQYEWQRLMLTYPGAIRQLLDAQ